MWIRNLAVSLCLLFYCINLSLGFTKSDYFGSQSDCLGSGRRICIPKCCPEGQVLDYGGNSFEPNCSDSGSGIKWTPNIQNVSIYHSDCLNSTGELWHFVHSDLIEENNATAAEDHQHTLFSLTPEGKLVVPEKDFDPFHMNASYCLDGLQNYVDHVGNYTGHKSHVAYGFCISFEEVAKLEMEVEVGAEVDTEVEVDPIIIHPNSLDPIQILKYWILLPFSSFFLFLIFAIYILVWSCHNIHGYTLFSYVCSLLGNYIFIFLALAVAKKKTDFCAVIGVCTHLFFLMTAAWLTIINFDIWHTFKYLKAGRPTKNLKRYLAYFGFAVGIPAVVVLVSGIMDASVAPVADNIRKNDTFVTPNYRKKCVVAHNAVLYYLFIPLGLLILTNIVFFIWTVNLLLTYRRSIRAVLKGSCTEKEDQSLRLFLKLFVVMGFSWSLELIGWGIKESTKHHVDTDSNKIIDAVIAAFDVFNLLLAVPIFFIFVWKRPIFNSLWLEYPKLRGLLSILLFCGCIDAPPDEKRPSVTGTFSLGTLGSRGGTMSRKRSTSLEIVTGFNSTTSSPRTSCTGTGLSVIAVIEEVPEPGEEVPTYESIFQANDQNPGTINA